MEPKVSTDDRALDQIEYRADAVGDSTRRNQGKASRLEAAEGIPVKNNRPPHQQIEGGVKPARC